MTTETIAKQPQQPQTEPQQVAPLQARFPIMDPLALMKMELGLLHIFYMKRTPM